MATLFDLFRLLGWLASLAGLAAAGWFVSSGGVIDRIEWVYLGSGCVGLLLASTAMALMGSAPATWVRVLLVALAALLGLPGALSFAVLVATDPVGPGGTGHGNWRAFYWMFSAVTLFTLPLLTLLASLTTGVLAGIALGPVRRRVSPDPEAP